MHEIPTDKDETHHQIRLSQKKGLSVWYTAAERRQFRKRVKKGPNPRSLKLVDHWKAAVEAQSVVQELLLRPVLASVFHLKQ